MLQFGEKKQTNRGSRRSSGGWCWLSLTNSGRDMVQAKTMKDKVGDLVELVHKLVLTSQLDKQEGLKQTVLETKVGLEWILLCAIILACTAQWRCCAIDKLCLCYLEARDNFIVAKRGKYYLSKAIPYITFSCLNKAKNCDIVLPQCNKKSPKINKKLQKGQEEIGKNASHSYCPHKEKCYHNKEGQWIYKLVYLSNITGNALMRFCINTTFPSNALKFISLSCQDCSPYTCSHYFLFYILCLSYFSGIITEGEASQQLVFYLKGAS